MKNNLLTMKNLALAACTLLCSTLHAATTPFPDRIHENTRTTPYPQEFHQPFINPAPLLVPPGEEGDSVQFMLSQDKTFKDSSTQISKPAVWRMFNPHRILKPGTWHWRFRSVKKGGEKMPWSPTYSFTMDADVPQFVTPPFETFLRNIPQNHARLYCFLDATVEEARKHMRQSPDFERMISEARDALAMDYRTDTAPYKKISLMYKHANYLHTAYMMMQRDVYAEKMVQNVRCLLQTEPDENVLANDFNAGELAYTLACTYETCYSRFSTQERQQIEELLLSVLNRYIPHIIGKEEVHIFDNHFWQFTFRHFLQAALVLHDKYPEARNYLEYSYELWTSRAPASGFNRDGNWHNGTSYFSANAVTLYYIAELFSYLTKTDFLQHPWYRNSGIGEAYSWLPNSSAAGFGDGHEKLNAQPLRIRSAYADYLARKTGDPYAAWYSSLNRRYLDEYETRIYRLASGKERPDNENLPEDAPKAVWFKDSGEMIANSDLNDLSNNLSLSFRSSPFGSGSHTHSNQNAFNLHFRGIPVYRAIGHYMNFADSHNLLSYRNTRAYNTILTDSIGQPFTTRAYGNIVRMFNGEHISYALGDASKAYCGISEYPMWEKNFKNAGLEQSPENGFGKTPLKKFRRHIFLLHPDKVLIYDELEADKEVHWDWLLHSRHQFHIENNRLTTVHPEGKFASLAEIFSEQPCKISQTDRYQADPNKAIAVRGEEFYKEWSIDARFSPCKKNRVLTLIQITPEGKKTIPAVRKNSNTFRFGDWTVTAELDADRPASLYIRNTRNNAAFGYGLKEMNAGGKTYRFKKKNASVLHDNIEGIWETKEMDDRPALLTGAK